MSTSPQTPATTDRDLAQTDRLLSIATSLSNTTLVLESFTGTEGV